jgi:hypothetical protein
MGNSETKLPSDAPPGAYQEALEDPMGPPIKIGSHAPGGRPPLTAEQRSIIFKKTGKKKTKSRLQLLKHTADKTKQEHFRDGKIIHIDELMATVREKTEEVVERARIFGSGYDSSNQNQQQRGLSMSSVAGKNMRTSLKGAEEYEEGGHNDDIEESIDLEAEARAHAEAEAQVGKYYPKARSRHPQQGGMRSAPGAGVRSELRANDDEDDWVDVALFDRK